MIMKVGWMIKLTNLSIQPASCIHGAEVPLKLKNGVIFSNLLVINWHVRSETVPGKP